MIQRVRGDARVHKRYIHLRSSSPGGSFGRPGRRFDVMLGGKSRGEYIGGMAERIPGELVVHRGG